MLKIILNLFLITILSACAHNNWISSKRAKQPVPIDLIAHMNRLGMSARAPVLVRIFKKEKVLEVWKQRKGGNFALLKSYPICAWSGKLGPKYMERDRQTPEGFYEITTKNMHALSNYYLSINIGFPNSFDLANGRTGSNLMIHGGCSSSGCYAMTDRGIAQIYALLRDAFLGGQHLIQIQAYPFRMTAKNMALYKNDNNYAFWKNLKLGYDIFELTHRELDYNITKAGYVFLNIEKIKKVEQKDTYYIKHSAKTVEPKNPKLQGIKGPSEAAKVAEWMRKAIRTGIVRKNEPLL